MFPINTQAHDGETPARPGLSQAIPRHAFTSSAGTGILRELEHWHHEKAENRSQDVHIFNLLYRHGDGVLRHIKLRVSANVLLDT